MRKRLFFVICLFFALLSLAAQEDNSEQRQFFTQAEAQYQLGQLEQATQLLESHLPLFKGNLKQGAYRLLSLCYLALDKEEECEQYALLLLRENPFYTSVHDPLRFSDIISRLKLGWRATITTASQQSETLEEAPVPVVLITEEMIKDVGARNLLDVLTAYVPGITAVESINELNFAMRGVYNSTQQSVLVMVDGHRINSHSTYSSAPDYSISIDKVKQIEVLRGPASSLYGNVALTGVINIITKDGYDVDGAKLSYGIGNNGQHKASVLFGKRTTDIDVTGWASLYTSQGETFFEKAEDGYGLVPIDGNVTLHKFSGKPAFDTGFKFRWKDFHAYYNYMYSKLTPSYSMDVFQAPYDYDRYRFFNGQSPGHSHSSHKGEFSYQHEFGKWTLKALLGFDFETNINYDIAGDTIPPVVLVQTALGETIYPTKGCYQVMTWNDYHIEGNLSAFYHYSLNGYNGSIYGGIQMERYRLTDNVLTAGCDFTNNVMTTSENTEYLANGSEDSFSAFLQLKQQYHNFILNAGLRYDKRRRFNSIQKDAFCPRVAIIYNRDTWNVKFSFNRAFVDASYFLRANTLPIYRGAEDLSPEFMNSFQLTFNHKLKSLNTEFEGNVFYNKLEDLIFYNSTTSATGEAYSNAGHYDAIGLEGILRYQTAGFRGSFNLTWQHVTSAENYVTDGHQVYNVPKLSYNLILGKKVFEKKQHQLWLHASANGICRQKSYIAPLPMSTKDEVMDIPSRIIFASGVDYNWKRLELSANVHNLFDKHYIQGGTSRSPIRQMGRWFLCTLNVAL
jgi:iron complex outermembrane receptor protein